MSKPQIESLLEENQALRRELGLLKDKLKHFEDVTNLTSSVVSVGSNEEELCKLEISRLYNAAKTGPLEFTEVKAFEIYVKSLMLIRGKTTVEEKKSKKNSSLTEEQLLQLALQVQVVDDTNEQ